jgi:hypothetical protein
MVIIVSNQFRSSLNYFVCCKTWYAFGASFRFVGNITGENSPIICASIHLKPTNLEVKNTPDQLAHIYIYIYIYKISCLLPWPHTLKKVHRGPVEVFSGLTRDLMVQNVPLDISRPLCWLWNENPYLTQGYICFYILKIFLKNWFFYLF